MFALPFYMLGFFMARWLGGPVVRWRCYGRRRNDFLILMLEVERRRRRSSRRGPLPLGEERVVSHSD